MSPERLTARCYCGSLRLDLPPAQTVAYCHCRDCKRWTGAPAPAFAAVPSDDVKWLPGAAKPRSFSPGVDRWTCPDCGSPMAARFDYLPGQIYVPLGVIDQIDSLAPELHCHAAKRVPWLHRAETLPELAASGRDALKG